MSATRTFVKGYNLEKKKYHPKKKIQIKNY